MSVKKKVIETLGLADVRITISKFFSIWLVSVEVGGEELLLAKCSSRASAVAVVKEVKVKRCV